jgi:hypothetical protein
MIVPQGKGYMIWKVKSCEGGDPDAIASVAASTGLSFVAVKVADGIFPFNVAGSPAVDLAAAVVDALHASGIQAWGWHYIYGNDPIGEANIAASRAQQLGLDGYILDAEGEFKQPGMDVAATAFLRQLRSQLPEFTLALCSYRYPSLHGSFPWSVFLNGVDLNMPMVYWEFAHNPDVQLTRCVQEFRGMQPVRPIIPVGPSFWATDWAPTPADAVTFMDTARAFALPGASFFSWDEAHKPLPDFWNAVAQYPWSTNGPAYEDISQKLIDSWNTHNPSQPIQLYADNAVHVSSSRTIQGKAAIQGWYEALLNEMLPNGSFALSDLSVEGSLRHFSWTASSPRGKVSDGQDTLGMEGDKILYHYTQFSVSPNP